MIWKITQKQNLEVSRNIRVLKKQNEHIANFMDTLRMSIEKISEDIYGNGKVNARMFQTEKEIEDLKKNFKQIAVYTGLNTKTSALDSLISSNSLKGKDFM